MKIFTFSSQNFPLTFQEKDLWKVFQRYGSIVDVLISRRLNNNKQRFGFVKFQGVLDVVSWKGN